MGARVPPAAAAVGPDESVENSPGRALPSYPFPVVGDLQNSAIPGRFASRHAQRRSGTAA